MDDTEYSIKSRNTRIKYLFSNAFKMHPNKSKIYDSKKNLIAIKTEWWARGCVAFQPGKKKIVYFDKNMNPYKKYQIEEFKDGWMLKESILLNGNWIDKPYGNITNNNIHDVEKYFFTNL